MTTMTKATLSILGLCVIGGTLLFVSSSAPAQTPPATSLNLPVVDTISPKVPAQTTPLVSSTTTPSLAVTNMQLIGERRVSRTVSELTYRLSVTNAGLSADGVRVVGSSKVAHVSFLDSEATVGSVATGQSQLSSDTVTIRHDRQFPMGLESVQWTVTYDTYRYTDSIANISLTVPTGYLASSEARRRGRIVLVTPERTRLPADTQDIPNISIEVLSNPSALSFEQYFDGDPGNELIAQAGEQYFQVSIGSTTAYKLDSISDLAGATSYVFTRPGEFIVVNDGAAFANSPVLQLILLSIGLGV